MTQSEVPSGYELRDHVPADYPELWALWHSGEANALGLSAADEEQSVSAFLERNAGLSLGLWRDGWLVGSILVGSDGRRGYIYHLIVRPGERGRGLGRLLVHSALLRLRGRGVGKAHAYVYADNHAGRGFWERLGFAERVELVVYSQETPVVEATVAGEATRERSEGTLA